MKKIIIYAMIIIYIAIFSILIWKNIHLFQYLTTWSLMGLTIATVLAMASIGMINYFLFDSAVHHLKPKDGLKMAVLNTIGNYLPFSAGLVGKGIYLKKIFGLEYKVYATLSFFMLIIQLTLSGGAGLVALHLLRISDLEIKILFGVLALIGTLLMIPLFEHLLPKAVTKMIGKMHSVKTYTYQSIGWLFFWQTVYLFFQTWILLLSFQSIGQECSFWQAMLYSSGMTLTRFLNILPGAIGIREGIVITLGLYTGLGIKEAVLGLGIARLATVSIVFTWGFLLYKNDMKKIIKPPDPSCIEHH